MPKFKPGDIIWRRRQNGWSNEVTDIVYKIVDVIWRFGERSESGGGRVEIAYQVYIVDQYGDYDDGYNSKADKTFVRQKLRSERQQDDHKMAIRFSSGGVDYEFNPSFDTLSIGKTDFNYKKLSKLEYLVVTGEEFGRRKLGW